MTTTVTTDPIAGNAVDITTLFTNAGVAADPDTVTWTVQRISPAKGSAATYSKASAEATNPTAGTHVLTIHPASPGTWAWTVDGAFGAVTVSDAGLFQVAAPPI